PYGVVEDREQKLTPYIHNTRPKCLWTELLQTIFMVVQSPKLGSGSGRCDWCSSWRDVTPATVAVLYNWWLESVG
ncbi:MAG: hypothetical protein WCB91_10555, partial [Halobacteriota archaeon]